MQWTQQQHDAIYTNGKSLIISASAGSGKTAVLVERLFQLLSDMEQQIKADTIIVVTFTNDAAAQMKHRLFKKISEHLDIMNRNGEQYTPRYDWLLRQRNLLNRAKICTIHSFCFDLIRENAELCGVNSQFSIVEPAQEYAYQKQVMHDVLEVYSKSHHEEIEYLFYHLCANDDSELEEILFSIANDLNSAAFPEHWLKEVKRLCTEENTLLLDRIEEKCSEEITAIIQSIEQSRIFAENAGEAFAEMPDKDIRKFQDKLLAIKAYIQKIKQNQKSDLIYDIKLDRMPSVKSGTLDDNALQNKEIFASFRDIYKNTMYQNLKKSFIQPLQYYQKDIEIQKKLIPLLVYIIEVYQDELQEKKRKHNVLGFDDAERLALSLLGGKKQDGQLYRTQLAEQNPYALLMVDEYQDSNDRQDYLFKFLSKNCYFSPDKKNIYYGNNVFLVGDAKQSIYSFRKANPENFIRTVKLAEQEKHPILKMNLNQNFRSSESVIQFVNLLFSSIMTENCGDLQYTQSEALRFGAYAYQKLESQLVEILLPRDAVQDTQEKPSKKYKKDLQAECIAKTIADMMTKQTPVMTSDGVRPCEYKDFCILLRSVKHHGKKMSEALKKYHIPFNCENNDGFLTLPEIRFIWNLLKILHNPMTDMAMAVVLLSPVYGFTAEDLAALKIESSQSKRLYLQIKTVSEQETPLAQKCRIFLGQLKTMRTLTEIMPLEQCIQEIYDMTDWVSLQSLYENAAQRREHLEIFVQYAQKYREHADLTAQSCLSGWLRYLEHLQEGGAGFTPQTAVNAQANYVSVKTIHKSKGLEYPFVFLAHMEDKFSNHPSYANVLLHADSLIGLKQIDRKNGLKISPSAYEYILHDTYRKQRSEELRLFYVALTRAKQKLFLLLNEKSIQTESFQKKCSLLQVSPGMMHMLSENAGSMQEWLVYFLISSKSEAPHFMQMLENGSSNCSSLASYNNWIYHGMENQIPEPEQKAVFLSAPDVHIIENIQKQLAYCYQSKESELPAKYSVTMLSHPEKAASAQITVPAFMQEDEEGNLKRLVGKSRGTAIHKMLQFMDFEKASENIQTERKRLLQMGFLKPIEAKALQTQKLKSFLESDLYRRIAAAKRVEKEKNLFVKIGELHFSESSELLQKYIHTDGVLIGTMDLLFQEEDGWVLVDYKTDAKTMQELIDAYALQLILYKKAAELFLQEPVKQAYIYAFDLERAIEIDLAQAINL